jgi:hypothetical protein
MTRFFKVMSIVSIAVLGLGGFRVSMAGIATSVPNEVRERERCQNDSPPGVIHALLIGVGRYRQQSSLPLLRGTANDVALLSQTLINKGVKPENMTILIDDQATVDGVFTAINELNKKIKCGDQLLVHFSGQSDGNALFTFDARQESGKWIGVINGDEFREKLSKLSYGYVPILIFMDTGLVESLKLPYLIRSSDKYGKIAIFYPGKIPDELPLPTELTVEHQSSTEEKETTKIYGFFSWCLTNSLTQFPGLFKIYELAANMNRCLINRDFSNSLSFSATDWDMTLNFPGVSTTPSSDPDIEFVNLPSEQRGLVINIKQPRFRLEGRIRGPDQPLATLVNNDVVKVNNGQFAHDITLETGRNEITVTALFANGRLAQRNAVLDYQGNIEALRGGGRLIALLIGNENYEKGWKTLKTPINDVKEMGKVLREQYGFSTELAIGLQKLDLELMDANRSQIGKTLNQLTKELRETDRLLVFYAGHGAQGSDTSFWIPVDADRDDDTTWFSGDELIRQLRKIPARQVLVIADSCFAGSLIRERDPESPPKSEDERLKYLERMSGNPARSYIASGGKEPVLDEGGSGHSIFASVLLKALLQPPPSKLYRR